MAELLISRRRKRVREKNKARKKSYILEHLNLQVRNEETARQSAGRTKTRRPLGQIGKGFTKISRRGGREKGRSYTYELVGND